MLATSYISTPGHKKFSLAEATWQEFRPFLSRYQWAFDNPGHSPRAAEIAGAILNRGKKGACTFGREGYKYVLPLLQTRHFEKAIANHRKLYYVSYGGEVLLYLDTDIHRAWQTVEDGQQAQSLLDRLTTRFFEQPVLFSSASTLGGNDYLKVKLSGMGYERANAIFTRLEHALQLFLAYCANMADFEVKGTVGYLKDGRYIWGKYGKLPIHHPDWNFARLEQFRSRPSVSIHGLIALCEQIEAQVPLSVLEQHKAYKKSKGDEPFFQGNAFLVTPAIEKAILDKHGDAWRCMYDCSEDRDGNVWIDRRYYVPGKVPITGREWQELRASSEASTVTQHQEPLGEVVSGSQVGPDEPPANGPTAPLKTNIKLVDLASESDSFERQKEALMRFSRYLKRVPSLEEALTYLHDQNLFTGPWGQNQAKRRRRVQDILKFIARSFDPGKCAHGSVNVGKYDEWAATKFSNGLIGRTPSSLDEDGHKIDGQAIHVKPAFIAAFMSVAEFALVIDKNQDDSVPHDRCEALWLSLKTKGLIAVSFDARKWAACREALAGLGIIVITDRNYHNGQAMKWVVGRYFPLLGLWKRAKLPSLLGPGCFPTRVRRTEQEHNTLLRWQPRDWAVLGRSTLPRPPPSLHVAPSSKKSQEKASGEADERGGCGHSACRWHWGAGGRGDRLCR